MKTCAKCGKNVANSTQMCPVCNSVAFYTERSGLEGGFWQYLNELLFTNPKAFWIIIGAIAAGFVLFLIWAFNS